MTSDSDAAVIEASLREPERFSVLFDRHAPFIYRYLARRVGPDTADDLVGETFLVAFGKRGRYDTGYPGARPWLYGIATHLVGQHRREEIRRYRLLQSAGPGPDLPDYAERVVADVTARSVRSQLAEGLAGIPGGDRDVLLLIAWEGLSYEEVALAMGIPVGTVRSRLHRARTRLRRSLEETDAAATYKEILTNE
jgi:RNA polymerase sigma factor (sigma-70 family)